MLSRNEPKAFRKSRKIKRNARGPSLPHSFGPRRLSTQPSHVSKKSFRFPSVSTGSGYVCLPGKHPTSQIRDTLATLAGVGMQRLGNKSSPNSKLLRQPTLESHFAMVGSASPKPAHEVPFDRSLLGWKCMVAPTSKNAVYQNTSSTRETEKRSFYRLPRAGDASYERASSLLDVIRWVLEGKQVPPQSIELYMNEISEKQALRPSLSFPLGPWVKAKFQPPHF